MLTPYNISQNEEHDFVNDLNSVFTKQNLFGNVLPYTSYHIISTDDTEHNIDDLYIT